MRMQRILGVSSVSPYSTSTIPHALRYVALRCTLPLFVPTVLICHPVRAELIRYVPTCPTTRQGRIVEDITPLW
jgi:hypothetical protein